jgi:hypothetical protein
MRYDKLSYYSSLFFNSPVPSYKRFIFEKIVNANIKFNKIANINITIFQKFLISYQKFAIKYY